MDAVSKQGPRASPRPGIQPHPDPGAHGLTWTRDPASPGPRAHGLTRTQGRVASPRPRGAWPHPDPGAHGLTRTRDLASPDPGLRWPHPDPGARGLSQTQGRVSHPDLGVWASSGPGTQPHPDPGAYGLTRTWDPASTGPRGAWPSPRTQGRGTLTRTQGPSLTQIQGHTASTQDPDPSFTRTQGRAKAVCLNFNFVEMELKVAPLSGRGPSKVAELGACLLRHQAFQKPPPSRRLLKGLVHQRTGTQLHREKRKRPPPGNVKMPNVPSTQPAIMKPTEEPPPYTQIAKEHALAQAELLKRQEELERKAAELDRREREMQNLSQHVHTVTLFLNIFGCLAWFCVDATRGVDFGLSILWFLLFTPCSFVCWYRPLYGAFRSDSSFRFFVFFFVYICQFAVHVLQAAGFHNWGNCCQSVFLSWLDFIAYWSQQSIPVGIMMIIIAALFTASAVISLVMFKKVHGLYRTTGASFEKAQQEFASGVMSNKTVQTAAANAASTAATSAAQNAFKGCNFCLCGEDGTDEGEDHPTDGSIKGPAQGAVSRFVGRCIVSTVGNGLLAAPASRVEYQAEDKEQACRAEEKRGSTFQSHVAKSMEELMALEVSCSSQPPLSIT
ncbi:hypothetical protein QTO34_013873, partial [Cnephaeus nilssonii]